MNSARAAQRRVDWTGLLFGVFMPFVVAGTLLWLTRIWEPRLPENVVAQWNAIGEPSRITPLWSNTWLLATLMVATASGLGAIAALRRALLSLRFLLLIVSTTVTGLFAGLWVGILIGHINVININDATLVGWPIAAGVALGGVTGFIAANKLHDGRIVGKATRRPPSHLPRAEASSFDETVVASKPMQILLVGTLIVVGGVVAAASRSLWPLALFVPLAFLLAAGMRAHIHADGAGLAVRIMGHTAFNLKTGEITKAEMSTTSPFGEFGGVGLRVRGSGDYGLVMRKGPAVVVYTAGGHKFTLTTDQPRQLAGILNSAADASRPE
ncbi:hypothetical protein IEU95_11980 [Hoyosella rhizosphaerae]|nr:hypothetical protein [Hoyosella rhizosphaerae]MBN4927552.1 hypothetical protein [Hoyosella rhizosphaerae]